MGLRGKANEDAYILQGGERVIKRSWSPQSEGGIVKGGLCPWGWLVDHSLLWRNKGDEWGWQSAEWIPQRLSGVDLNG